MSNKKGNETSLGIDFQYGAFWDECRSIRSESRDGLHSEAERKVEENKEDDVFDDDMQWLTDIGFSGVIDKYKDHAEIDPDDAELQSMTATLTRRQSATVRKRIESLNDTWKRLRQPQSASRHPDVRSLFPVKTDGESSTSPEIPTSRLPEHVNENHNHGYATANHMSVSASDNLHVTADNRSGLSHSTVAKALPGILHASHYADNSRNTPNNAKAQSKTSGNQDTKQELADYRKAIDTNMNVFYSVQPDQKARVFRSPQPVHAARPPPPRRAKSEDMFRVDVATTRQHKKSPSADSQILNKVSTSHSRSDFPTRYLSPYNSNASKSASPSRSLDMNQLTTSRSRSPKHERIKHKSEEDLSQLRSRNEAAEAEKQRLATTSRNPKPSQHSIDGDAKLNIGSDSTGKDATSLINGQAFPVLPNFSLKQERTGMTQISDLSDDDMAKVRSLALIELTALFDNCGIAVSRRKHFSKPKQKENGIFGVALSFLLQKDQTRGSKGKELRTPRFFKDLINFLERNGLKEEGMLRVTGSQARIKALREEIEECYGANDNFNWEGRQTRDMAAILKQFLRELPIPLLTHEYQRTFIAVSDLNDRKLQLQALNLLILLLQSVHRDTLQILLRFLSKIVQLENCNKMDLNNVSMIMAPNLFLQPDSRANLNEIHKLAATTDVMRMLIKYNNIIWMVPDFMVTQIRYLNEAGTKARDAKAVKKIIAKRMKSETTSSSSSGKQKHSGSGDEVDAAEVDDDPIIRVKAPMFNKICMAIQLTERTTASDIIARFRSKRNSIKELTEISRLTIGTSSKRSRSDSDVGKDEGLTLYEIGGNIGERRLDPNTNMMALLKVNPNAEWLLKIEPLSA